MSVLTWTILSGVAVEMNPVEVIKAGVVVNKIKQYQEFAPMLGILAIKVFFIQLLYNFLMLILHLLRSLC
jgi:hypothetical protein